MKAFVAVFVAAGVAGCVYSKDTRIQWGETLVYDAEATAANPVTRQPLLGLEDGLCFLLSIENANVPAGWVVNVAKGGDPVPSHWWLEVSMNGPRISRSARLFARAVCFRNQP